MGHAAVQGDHRVVAVERLETGHEAILKLRREVDLGYQHQHLGLRVGCQHLGCAAQIHLSFAAAGVANFALNTTKTQLYGTVGTYTITYSATGVTAATQSLTLTYGAANKLAMTSPTNAVNDAAFGVQPIVTIQDQDANTVADSTATVTVTASPAGLGGTTSMAAVAGVADFAGKGIKLTGTIGDYTLTYAIAGPISTTQTVTLAYGAADHLADQADPADATGDDAAVDAAFAQTWAWLELRVRALLALPLPAAAVAVQT